MRDNLGFGLRMRGVPRAEIARRVEEVARILGLEQLLGRRPAELSGGQRQRVALGRAIVREPKAFLLDEPLSNLDAKLRTETRAELARLHRRLGATMLYVTHDQEEAMTLGDRIVVLRGGALQQAGAPLDVYRRPANVFVAGFVGSPPMNLLPCRIEAGSGGARLRGKGFTVPLRGAAPPPGRDLLLGIRPHEVRLGAPGAGDANARVEVVETLGSALLLHATLEAEDAGPRVVVVAPADQAVAVDERVGLRFDAESLHLFDAESGERLVAAGSGQPVGAPNQKGTFDHEGRSVARPSEERAVTAGFPRAHTFSFADYHDPEHMGFRTLRVINEDHVAPGQGFGKHPHRDMEILTWVLSGALRHEDSLGNGSVIRPGDLQRMSAGTGVVHSEWNASDSEPVHFLQIWILPSQHGLPPSYEQQSFGPEELRNRLRLVASPDGRDGSVRVHQAASLRVATLEPGVIVKHTLPPDAGAWLQVARGDVALGSDLLEAGDGVAVSGEPDLELRAETAAELLLFELA